MLEEDFSIYLAPYQAVYIDIAKVASSSIKARLAAVLMLDGAGGNPHLLDFPHPPAQDPDGTRLYPNLYSFAFVRNPWDRLVSCYRDKIAGEVSDFTEFAESGVAHCLAEYDEFAADMSFRDFVYAVASIPDADSDEHFRSQTDYLTNSAGVVAIDFVGRYENLAADFTLVASHIGLSDAAPLPRLQAAPKRDFWSYYTQDTLDIVGDRYAQDIKLLNYQPSSSQCR